jgi:hypothetical protein
LIGAILLYDSGKEVFQFILPPEIFGKDPDIGPDGYFTSITLADAKINIQKELDKYAKWIPDMVLATDLQLIDAAKDGSQQCTSSAFESAGKLQGGYILQDAVPGSCALGDNQPRLYINGASKGWAPWGVMVYGTKPPKDVVASTPELNGRVWSWYRPSAGSTAPEIWSRLDTKRMYWNMHGVKVN